MYPKANVHVCALVRVCPPPTTTTPAATARYALNRKGEAMPWSIIADSISATQPYEVFALRAMLAVPFFEKVRGAGRGGAGLALQGVTLA